MSRGDQDEDAKAPPSEGRADDGGTGAVRPTTDDAQTTLASALNAADKAMMEEAGRARLEAKTHAASSVRTASSPPLGPNDTLIGGTGAMRSSSPPPIVPRRRTPVSGLPVASPAPAPATAPTTTLIGGVAVIPRKLPPGASSAGPLPQSKPPLPPGMAPRMTRMTPASAPPAPSPNPPILSLPGPFPPSAISPDGGAVSTVHPAIAKLAMPAPQAFKPPVIRVPQGGMLESSAPRATESQPTSTRLCDILLRNGAVTEEAVDRAIALQEERGGQIGRILVSIGACTEEAIARALLDQLKVRKNRGFDADVSVAAREHKDVAGLRVLTKPLYTVLALLLTDIVSLFLAALLASSVHWIRTYSDLGGIDWTSWLVVAPAIALCMLTYLGLELYSPMAKSTPDEIRDVVFATSLVHLGASMLSTLGNLPIVKWGIFVRSVWWLGTLVLVPVLRALVRNRLCTQAWWGIPVCVLGAAKTGRLIVRTLKAQPRSGLKPVMLLDDDPAKHGTLRASFTNEVMDVYSVNVSAAQLMTEAQRKELSDDLFGPDADPELSSGSFSSDHLPAASPYGRAASPPATSEEHQFLGPESAKPRGRRPPTKDASQFPRGKFAEVDGVPVVGDLSLAPILAQRLKIPYAVLAMPGVDGPKLVQIVERVGGKFSHLLVIPDLFGFATLGVPAKNLGGILGVEVRQQLLLPGPRLAKRVMDAALTSVGVIFVLPFLALIALLIKLDSKGPVFYTQKRLGKDGEFFKAYKFRTMHGDGEERLKAILSADPQLRAEYEIYHKLRKDPRVTRIGRVLRKFSLDEFPQLVNVIAGDMSLVGPRPYIEREVTEMAGQEKIILRAPPGMTGMWQVSDRNATSFAQRVQIDVYYVRNWSPWLDVHILAKTLGVVIKGSGV